MSERDIPSLCVMGGGLEAAGNSSAVAVAAAVAAAAAVAVPPHGVRHTTYLRHTIFKRVDSF